MILGLLVSLCTLLLLLWLSLDISCSTFSVAVTVTENDVVTIYRVHV